MLLAMNYKSQNPAMFNNRVEHFMAEISNVVHVDIYWMLLHKRRLIWYPYTILPRHTQIKNQEQIDLSVAVILCTAIWVGQ